MCIIFCVGSLLSRSVPSSNSTNNWVEFMPKVLRQNEQAYDQLHLVDNRLTLNWYPQRVVQMARQGGSMLELGLGHGFSTAFFAQAFERYMVVEGSPEMIARFRENFEVPSLEIVESYFENFQTDERFDAIGMGFVLEHVDDPALVLRRFSQFLAPGGSVFIAVPNAEALHRRFGHAAGMLPDMTALSAADLEFGHQRYFTVQTLRDLVDSVGLSVIKTEGLLLKPITTRQLVELDLDERILQGMLKVGVDYPELCNSILMQVGRA